MDLMKLKDVGVRKKMKADVGKLKEKISNETAKIIKLKVGQDTAYWELKEKLASVERNHENLQQNMLSLQMQHEQLSSQYQEELRRRPEIAHKLGSVNKINEVLEEHVSRVRASLQRSAVDRAALAEAYTTAAAKVAAAHAENEKRIAAAVNEARSAQHCAKLKDEHSVRLSQCVELINSRAEKALAEVDRMRDQRDCLAEKMAKYEAVIQEKEKTVQELREEMRRAATEHAERMERQRKAIADFEREAGVASALREAISQAESRNEALTRDVRRLSSELAVANDAAQRAATLKQQNQELQSNIEELKRGMSYIVNKSEAVSKELDNKTQKLQSVEEALAESQKEARAAIERISTITNENERERRKFEERITTLTNEHTKERERERREFEEKITTASTKIAEEIVRERNNFQDKVATFEHGFKERDETIARLKHEVDELTKTRDEVQATVTELTATLERQRSEKNECISNLEHSIAEKVEFISRLERELSIEKEKLANANTIIDEQKNELERERSDFEERKAALEKQLTERDEANAQLRRDLAVEVDKFSCSEDVLNATRAELNTARADAAHALDNVRRLEASVRSKDDEAAKQMKIILNARAENEQLQEKIRTMEGTIKDIQKITNKSPPGGGAAVAASRNDPPEQDHNTMAAPPVPLRGGRPNSPIPARRRQLPPLPDLNDSIYSLFSDTDSMDDPLDINRRFDAMSRGIPVSPISFKTLKRRHVTRKQHQVSSSAPAIDCSQPASAEPQTRAAEGRRKFFKTRRTERSDTKKN